MTHQAWEYETHHVNDGATPTVGIGGHQLSKFMSEMGAEGWELVTVASIAGRQTLFWKRPKVEKGKGAGRFLA